MMNLPLRLLTAFQKHHAGPPTHLLQVPGREMWVAAVTGKKYFYTLMLPDIAASITFDERSARRAATWAYRPAAARFRYLLAVARWLAWESLLPAGGQIVVAGNEPAGPRYDHALGMAFITLAYVCHGIDLTETQLLGFMERVEREYLISPFSPS